MYLLDTNLLLEVALDQEKAEEVKTFLKSTSRERAYISEFTFYSVGVRLFRQKRFEAFSQVVNDLIMLLGIEVIRLDVSDMDALTETAQKFTLDFDDAYQYVAAEKHDLTLVSFDADFDRTERGRKTPAQILETL